METEEQTISLSGFNKPSGDASTAGVLGLSQVQNSNMGFGVIPTTGFGSGFSKNFGNVENQSQDQNDAQNQNMFGTNQTEGLFGSQNVQSTGMFGNQIFS